MYGCVLSVSGVKMKKEIEMLDKPKVKKEYYMLQYDDITRETDKAFLVDFELERCWLPKSQVEVIDETYSLIQVPEWLVSKNELHKYAVEEE